MSRPKVVLLGMLTKIPVGGVMWLVRQYAVGFERLGYDVYYVEAHGRVPSMFMEHEHDHDATPKAVAFLADQMSQNGMGDRWAFHAVHEDGRCYGLSRPALDRLYRDAALIINLHGSTVPLEEHAQAGRLVYMGTDPVELELELHRGDAAAIAFLEPHIAFFTWGLNYGGRDCLLPYSERFPLVPSAPPVIVDLWQAPPVAQGHFTTIGNWRQDYRDLEFQGEVYHWSKHYEFLKVLQLPRRVAPTLELSLSTFEESDRELLEGNGWIVRDGLALSRNPDSYREYIRGSRGEFTVAKDQNVRLRTGWFSERSAAYLAAGRPVVTQDTGFGEVLPTGDGLFSFTDVDSAADAIERVEADYERHSAAAVEIARSYFQAETVLGALLRHVGLAPARGEPITFGVGDAPFPASLTLTPLDRDPLRLSPETLEVVLSRPVPRGPRPVAAPAASIVVVTDDDLLFTRMALESVLANTRAPYEVIVVDNDPRDATLDYLSQLAAHHDNVRVVSNDFNMGFAAAHNTGLEIARAPVLVLLDNNTVVPWGWLRGLTVHLDDPLVGLVGPVTSRIWAEAEMPLPYDDFAGFAAFSRRRAASHAGKSFAVPVLTTSCLAMRRETFSSLGPLEEAAGTGTVDDDGFSSRARQAGLKVVCAEDVFVHHFG